MYYGIIPTATTLIETSKFMISISELRMVEAQCKVNELNITLEL